MSFTRVRLGDLIEERIERCPDPQESGYDKFIGLEHMDTGRLEVKRYGSTDDVTTSCKVCHKGDILFGRRNPYLRRAGLVNFDATCSGDIIVFRASSDRILPEYIPIVLATKQFWTAAMADQGGTMSKRVHFEDFARYEFDLPNMDTQQKLSDLIWSYEELIGDCELQIQNFEMMVKSRFIELLNRYKDQQSNKATYEEICTIITDGEHVTPKRSDSGFYLLSARNISNHSLSLDDVDFIPTEEYERISKRIVPISGDILISCSGTIGRVCTLPENFKCQMVRSVALLRLKNDIDNTYFEWLVDSDFTQNQIRNAVHQSAQANLFQGKIRKLIAVIPPIDEQKDFAKFVKQVDKSISKLEQYLDYLKTMQISVINGPRMSP